MLASLCAVGQQHAQHPKETKEISYPQRPQQMHSNIHIPKRNLAPKLLFPGHLAPVGGDFPVGLCACYYPLPFFVPYLQIGKKIVEVPVSAGQVLPLSTLQNVSDFPVSTAEAPNKVVP